MLVDKLLKLPSGNGYIEDIFRICIVEKIGPLASMTPHFAALKMALFVLPSCNKQKF